MLGVPYVSSREKLFLVKFMLGVPYVSSRDKLFPVKFMLGVPYVSSPWKTIPCENSACVPYVSSPWKTIPVKFMLGVSFVFPPFKPPCVVYACACSWRVTSINASQLLEMNCYCFVSAADALSFSDSCVFIARQYTNARKWYGNYVCLSVRLSVRFLYLYSI